MKQSSAKNRENQNQKLMEFSMEEHEEIWNIINQFEFKV